MMEDFQQLFSQMEMELAEMTGRNTSEDDWTADPEIEDSPRLFTIILSRFWHDSIRKYAKAYQLSHFDFTEKPITFRGATVYVDQNAEEFFRVVER